MAKIKRPKPGVLFSLQNRKFTMGEHASGYLGLIVVEDGEEVELELTTTEIESMRARRIKNPEDWADIEEADVDCQLKRWIKNFFGK